METYLIGPAISLIGSLAAFAFGYGSLSARLKAFERDIEHTVSREEFKALSKRLDDVVSELRGLRSDLLAIVKERR